MSNRTQKQIDKQAELRVAHLAQIDALTAPGLSDEDRVRRFCKAAAVGANRTMKSLYFVARRNYRLSPAKAVWLWGIGMPRSIFGDLPGCACPVNERLEGVPWDTPNKWEPSRELLEVFSKIQIERRFPA